MVKLYVGNLSYDEDDESLRTIFQDYGEVKRAEIVLYRKSGKSRGFGFVEMQESEAQIAIDGLNEVEINGRVLKVNVSDPNVNQPNLENSEFTRLYVGNLTPDMDVSFLSKVFTEFGRINSAMIILDEENTSSEGFGFVEMSTNDQAIQALSHLDGKDVEGITMRVNWAKPKPRKPFRRSNNHQGNNYGDDHHHGHSHSHRH